MTTNLTPHKIDLIKDILSHDMTSGTDGFVCKNIPIELLPLVREYFKLQNIQVRIRYRGQRNHPLDKRSSSQRQQDCLKQFANRFSVYRYAEHLRLNTNL